MHSAHVIFYTDENFSVIIMSETNVIRCKLQQISSSFPADECMEESVSKYDEIRWISVSECWGLTIYCSLFRSDFNDRPG